MKRILIANRGEIAVRITRTLQRMGLTAIAVYSDCDAASLHVRSADEAYALGGNTPLESYLDQQKLFDVIARHNIDAVHPGYGFLSENAGFARACRERGVKFIGPTPEVIHAMGDKLHAKSSVVGYGVPVVPSYEPPADATLEDFRKAAGEIGFPLLVKAAAGGGGKGMRRVNDLAGVEEAVERAQHEALKAFGDQRVFLERYLERPRHVEIQIMGDEHGNVVHLGERECSIQRRYQKIFEESPCPVMTDELRARMGEAACAAARGLGYSNAGTVEFLLDSEGRFYFLEVNTRLQVEHPITELVYGVDLVQTQIEVARGERLPWHQEQLAPRGWAMEARLYAEDPERNFAPSTGTLDVYRPPGGPGIRIDSGVDEGSQVSIYYDPMLAKLVSWGADREQARQRMSWALRHFPVLGVRHNLEFLQRLVEHPEFVAGHTHTHFLTEQSLAAPPADAPLEAVWVAAQASARRLAPAQAAIQESPFVELGAWRMLA